MCYPGCRALVLVCLLVLAGCVRPPPAIPLAAKLPVTALPVATTLADYWYPHGAELSRYELDQARYGTQHPGSAVLIFVTENFDPAAQVKDEGRPTQAPAVPILKLNAVHDFTTGVYPYHLMTSVFMPVTGSPDALKVSFSATEWCGHSFTQLNRRPTGWQARQLSYFQATGDRDELLAGAASENALWVRLRLDPASLPTGELQLIPDLAWVRLTHQTLAPLAATATLADEPARPGESAMRRYTVTYAAARRTLSIRFQAAFPYLIEGWEESYPAGKDGQLVTTRATRTHSRMLPYWERHFPADRALRPTLGLPE